MESLAEIVRTDRSNAVGSWLLSLVLLAASVESLLHGAYLWSGFVVVCLTVVVLPPLVYRDPTLTVPWPHLGVLTGAVVVRTTGWYPELAGYLAVATLAILLVVELTTFTSVELTRRFSILFGVLTTMALQGWWAVAQFYADRWLGTDLIVSQTELQWDFVAVSVVAFGLAVTSELSLGSSSGGANAADRPG